MDANSDSPALTPRCISPAPPLLGRHSHGGTSGLPAPVKTPMVVKSAKRKAAEDLLAARYARGIAAAATACTHSSFQPASFRAHSAVCSHTAAAESVHVHHASTPAKQFATQASKASVGRHSAKVKAQSRKAHVTKPAQSPTESQPQGVERDCEGGPTARSLGLAMAASMKRAAQYLCAAATLAVHGPPQRLVPACANSAACCSPPQHVLDPLDTTNTSAYMPGTSGL